MTIKVCIKSVESAESNSILVICYDNIYVPASYRLWKMYLPERISQDIHVGQVIELEIKV